MENPKIETPSFFKLLVFDPLYKSRNFIKFQKIYVRVLLFAGGFLALIDQNEIALLVILIIIIYGFVTTFSNLSNAIIFFDISDSLVIRSKKSKVDIVIPAEKIDTITCEVVFNKLNKKNLIKVTIISNNVTKIIYIPSPSNRILLNKYLHFSFHINNLINRGYKNIHFNYLDCYYQLIDYLEINEELIV